MVSRKKSARPEQPVSPPARSEPPTVFVLEDWVDLSSPVPEWLATYERDQPSAIDEHRQLVARRAWRRAVQAASQGHPIEDVPA